MRKTNLLTAIAAGLLLALPAIPAADTIRGPWKAELQRGDKAVRFDFDGVSAQDRAPIGMSVPLDELDGLTLVDFQQSGFLEALRFRWTREAGQIVFDGEGGDRFEGNFTFAADREYAAALVSLGYADTADRDLFRLAVFDVRIAFVKSLYDLGYVDLVSRDLITLALHRVTIEYIRGLKDLGYDLGVEDLVKLRIHGADPEWVLAFISIGLDPPSVDELVRLKIHGVRVKDARAFVEHGLTRLDVDDLVKLRTHGVTPKFVEFVMGVGYAHLSIDDMVRMRNHGISAGYLRQMARSGLRGLAIDDLIKMQTNGIRPEYVEQLAAADFDVRRVDDLVELKTHGVEAGTVVGWVELGYDFGVEELVRLQSHGIGPEFVRGLSEAGYENLTVDELVRIKSLRTDVAAPRRKIV